jgi:hypothetical protein
MEMMGFAGSTHPCTDLKSEIDAASSLVSISETPPAAATLLAYRAALRGH